MDKISPKKWDWLKQRNSVQCKWAFQYLSKKNLIFRTSGMSDYKAITSLFESWPDDADHRETLNRVKGAWKTHTNRGKQINSKSYNFVLQISVKKHLDALAKQRGLTINKTLEALIEESHTPPKPVKIQTDTKAEKTNSPYAETPQSYDALRHPLETTTYKTDSDRLKDLPCMTRDWI